MHVKKLFLELFPVSAYVGSSENLKDLMDFQAMTGRAMRVFLATSLLAVGLLLAVGTFSEDGRAESLTALAQAGQHVASVLHTAQTGGAHDIKADPAKVQAATASGESDSANKAAGGALETKADSTPVKEATASGMSDNAGKEEKAKAGGRESLDSALKRRVRRCAKQITGDESPRKLEPTILAEVMRCAQDFMPAMDTANLLTASENKLLAAAKTPQEKKDAMAAIAEVNDEPSAKPDSSAPAKAAEAKSALANAPASPHRPTP